MSDSTSGGNRVASHSRFSDSEYRDHADFRYAIRRFLRFAEEQARAEGITPQQHLLLLLIRGHEAYPDVSIGQIAERLQVRHHSASLLVERGVRRGLLDRRVDTADRRRALVCLTDDGQDVLDRIMTAVRRELGSLEGALFRDSLRDALHAYNSARESEPVVSGAARVSLE